VDLAIGFTTLAILASVFRALQLRPPTYCWTRDPESLATVAVT